MNPRLSRYQPFYEEPLLNSNLRVLVPEHVVAGLKRLEELTGESRGRIMDRALALFISAPRPPKAYSGRVTGRLRTCSSTTRLIRQLEETLQADPPAIVTAALEDFLVTHRDLIQAGVGDWDEYRRTYKR